MLSCNVSLSVHITWNKGQFYSEGKGRACTGLSKFTTVCYNHSETSPPQKHAQFLLKIKYMCRCRPNTKIPKNLTPFGVSNLGSKVED